ncbi:Cyclin-dependent kinase 10 [Podila minutissima]|uniref:cyclin-dependent kinase n=1 Tax=Podila minutissima TaxID=64525 RepID=A0A9P5VK77_9FUNG|nr:Cyclin-dependent kinase 10 [Podila minutissima]
MTTPAASIPQTTPAGSDIVMAEANPVTSKTDTAPKDIHQGKPLANGSYPDQSYGSSSNTHHHHSKPSASTSLATATTTSSSSSRATAGNKDTQENGDSSSKDRSSRNINSNNNNINGRSDISRHHSSHQDRGNSNSRNDRQRTSQSSLSGNKDRPTDFDASKKREVNERERSSTHSRGRDGGRDKDSHSQQQNDRHHQHRQQQSLPKDSQSKDKDRERENDKEKEKDKGKIKDADANADSITIIASNTNTSNKNPAPNSGVPDPYKLLSITGRVGTLNREKAFFGTSRIVDDFEKLNKVGEGTYGVVYKAKDKKTGDIVALKRIRMERESDGLPISSLREIKLLKTLRHENVVFVKEVAVGRDLDQIFLVMEYCEQDMAALMDNIKKPYAPSEVKCLMYQLLKGIEYCHDHYVIHRDLKLSNLLLNAQGILKIADFGLARSFGMPSRPMTPKVVTLWYRAPELLLGDPSYTTAVDMWSAGCIFGELLNHTPLLPGKVERQQIDLIIELLGTPHEKIWQGFNKLPGSSLRMPDQRFNNLKNKFPSITDAARSLLSGLLTYDPKKRLSVKQALAHPYFFEAPPAKHPSLLPTHPEIRNVQSESQREDNLKMKRQPPPEPTENSNNQRKRQSSIASTPGPDPIQDIPNFEHCKNPTQLEKSITYYLRTNPTPADQALVAMLHACAELCRAASPSERPIEIGQIAPHHQHHQSPKNNPLLQTILDSSRFTSDQVFRIASTIHDTVAIQANPAGPSTKVTNAFLNVCAVTGQLDRAYEILQDMAHTAQGGVKPDLATFRNVLRTAATAKRHTTTDADAADLSVKIDKVIELGTDSLVRQARISFGMKLGLGGLAGATVGKFTTMGVMALPTNVLGRPGPKSIEAAEAAMVVDTEHPLHGIVHVLTSSEAAMGIGLTAGLLTAGYFVLGNTRKVAVEHQQKYHDHHHQLPRAKLLGMYFPDLATTDRDEIRSYLSRIVEN